MSNQIIIEGRAEQAMRMALFHQVTQTQVLASLPASVDRQRWAALFLAAVRETVDSVPGDRRERFDPGANPRARGLWLRAMQVAASTGLRPGKAHGELYFIPRMGWRDRPDEISVMPGWRGFKRLMLDAPGIADVYHELVHVRDTIRVGAGGVLESHVFDPFDDARTFNHPDPPPEGHVEPWMDDPYIPGGLRGGYLVIITEDGRVKYHFVAARKVHRNMRSSENPTWGEVRGGKRKGEVYAPPWVRWYEEQAIKTLYRDAWARRVINVLPDQVERLAAADEADNTALVNRPTALPAPVVDVAQTSAAPDAEVMAAVHAKPAVASRQQVRAILAGVKDVAKAEGAEYAEVLGEVLSWFEVDKPEDIPASDAPGVLEAIEDHLAGRAPIYVPPPREDAPTTPTPDTDGLQDAGEQG